jgi:hypothetical protein
MKNKKSITAIFLTVLFTLFIITGIPATSISSETTTVKDVKDVKEEKQIKPDKEVKQAQKETEATIKLGKEVKEQKNPYEKAEITIKIIPAVNKTFCYDILLNGNPLLHQPSIPGLPGKEGFTTKERAQKVAEFVVNKIRKNEMPPLVTIEDLNNMGVLQ